MQMAEYTLIVLRLLILAGISVAPSSASSRRHHQQESKEFVGPESDLNHLGFEAEDDMFMEQILEESPLKDEGLVEALTLMDVEESVKRERVKRTAIHSDDNLWEYGRIHYVFSDPIHTSDIYKDAIYEAIDHIQEVTCIRFKELNAKTAEKVFGRRQKYVKFVRGKSCHSSVGRGEGIGEQRVTLSRTCAYPEMVIHELGHLLGLWHEHARTDRDNNVLVLINNVNAIYQHNFQKAQPMRMLAPYDLSSMMHYDMTTFTSNGERTITPLDPDMALLIGHKRGFSFYDTYTLNTLYRCSAHCTEHPPVCENGGYVSKNCSCTCPEGLTGVRCHQVITHQDCGGVLQVNESLEVTSPGYPDEYPDGITCKWFIKSPEGTVMSLSVPDIDLEKSPLGTCRDQLEIRYHHIGINRGPVYCGTQVNRTFETTSNLMILRFSSNYVNARKGFRAVITVKRKTDCDSNPCRNGGTCHEVPEIGTYMCECQHNWVGHDCDKEIRTGGWADWSNWTQCVATCGRQSRTRTCTDPEPQNGGGDCEGGHYETRSCGTEEECQDALTCDFGTDQGSTMCGMTQERDTDDLDWQMHQGATSSLSTGPVSGHTSGDNTDHYLYLEASFGRAFDDAIVWFPSRKWKVGLHCLQFFYNMRGEAVGTLVVLRKITANRAVVMWQRSGHQNSLWNEVNINVLFFRGVELGFVAVRGGTYSSDIAVDDISISPTACNSDEYWSHHKYGCTFNGDRKRVGPFAVTDGCVRLNCFCNLDGHVDCPEWQSESICDALELVSDSKTPNHLSWKPKKGMSSSKAWGSKKQHTSGYAKNVGLKKDKWPHWLKIAGKRRIRRRMYRV